MMVINKEPYKNTSVVTLQYSKKKLRKSKKCVGVWRVG